jgi:hypothetical protein
MFREKLPPALVSPPHILTLTLDGTQGPSDDHRSRRFVHLTVAQSHNSFSQFCKFFFHYSNRLRIRFAKQCKLGHAV